MPVSLTENVLHNTILYLACIKVEKAAPVLNKFEKF